MLPDTIGHNVIGEIKGTEFPDEIITIGGHLDSWDQEKEPVMTEPGLYKALRF